MPTLEYLTLTAKERVPTAKVFITHNGSIREITDRLPNAPGAITINRQFGTAIAGATVKLLAKFGAVTPSLKDIIEIQLGYNGLVQRQFVGVITNVDTSSFPYSVTLQCSDILWIADFTVQESRAGVVLYDEEGNPVAAQTGGIVLDGPGGTPNFVPANDAILRLLRDWAGIPEFRIQIPPLETSPGNAWVLGKLSPVTWSGVSPLQAALEIVDVLGYWLYCDESGFIRARKMSGAPPANATFTYEDGVNMLTKAMPSMTLDLSRVYNEVVVTGGNTLIAGDNVYPVWDSRRAELPTFIPDGKYRQFSYSNRFIEYVTRAVAGEASAEAVAERQMLEHTRIPRTITGTIKGNPFLQIGQGVRFKGERLGFKVYSNFFLYAINTTFGGGVYENTITLDGGIGTAGYTTNPAPTAAFTFRLLYENLENEGEVVEIFCDASTSTSSYGANAPMTYAWSCATGNPSIGVGKTWMTRVPADTVSVVITLVVTDPTGKSSEPYTLTIPITASGELPAARILNFAADTWYVTPDAGKTWRSAPAAAIAVPPVSAGGDIASEGDDVHGLLATGGLTGATIRRTLDRLETPPDTLVDTGGSGINFIWQHELFGGRVWIAKGNSVYFSQDGGTTFGPARTPPVDAEETDKSARWVVESRDQLGTATALAGNAAFTTFDLGVTWTPSLEGPSGTDALCYASGHGKHWVGFKMYAQGGSPLRSFDDDVAVFPVDVDPPVNEIRALTMAVNEPVMFAYDAQGRVWRMSTDTGADATHVCDVPSTPNHAVRDGEFPLVYIAADNGLYKHFTDINVVVLMKGLTGDEFGYKVGYAGWLVPREPDLMTREYITTTDDTNAPGVWHLKDGVWTNKTGNLPTDNRLHFVTANPAVPGTWAAYYSNNGTADVDIGAGGKIVAPNGATYSAYWVTNDSGATWREIDVTIDLSWEADAPWVTYAPGASIEWSHDGTRLCIPFVLNRGPNGVPFLNLYFFVGALGLCFTDGAGNNAGTSLYKPSLRENPSTGSTMRQTNFEHVSVTPVESNQFGLMFNDIYATGRVWKGYINADGVLTEWHTSEYVNIDTNGYMLGRLDAVPGSKLMHLAPYTQAYRYGIEGTNLQSHLHWYTDATTGQDWETDGQANGDNLATLADGIYYAQRAEGVYVNGAVFYGAEQSDYIRADRQTHTALAVYFGDATALSARGYYQGEWEDLPPIPSVDFDINATIEPIVSGTTDATATLWHPAADTLSGGINVGFSAVGSGIGPAVGGGHGAQRAQSWPVAAPVVSTGSGATGVLYWGWAEPGAIKVVKTTNGTIVNSELGAAIIGNNQGDPRYYNLGLTASTTYVHAAWIVGGTGLAFTRTPVANTLWEPVRTIDLTAYDIAGANCLQLQHNRSTPSTLTITFRDGDGAVYVTQSTNSGDAWTDPVQVATTSDDQQMIYLPHRGTSHFAWSDEGTIYCAVWDGSDWNVEEISTAGAEGSGPSISVSDDGTVGVLYQSLSGLELAVRTGIDNWSLSAVDVGDEIVGTPTLVMGNANRIAIVVNRGTDIAYTHGLRTDLAGLPTLTSVPNSSGSSQLANLWVAGYEVSGDLTAVPVFEDMVTYTGKATLPTVLTLEGE
jgi:hypothetical protein